LAVAIRLTRVGATKRPAYRVIAIDKRRSRDGRALEILGFYDPLTDPATVQLDTDKIKAWIGKGAQPSETVVKLMRQAERVAAGGPASEAPKRSTRAAKPKGASRKKAADEDGATAADTGADAATAEQPEAEPPPDTEATPPSAGDDSTAAAADGEGEKADA
jgi:small subunit ribosomal protein S16